MSHSEHSETNLSQASVITLITYVLPTMMNLSPNLHDENWTQLGFAGSPDIGPIQALRKDIATSVILLVQLFLSLGKWILRLWKSCMEYEIMAFNSLTKNDDS